MVNERINDFTDGFKQYHNELKKYDILKSQEEEFDLKVHKSFINVLNSF